MREVQQKSKPCRVSTSGFILFFAYTMLIWFCECLDLLAWLIGIKQETYVSRIMATLLMLCLLLRLEIRIKTSSVRKKFEVTGWFEADAVGFDSFFLAASIFLVVFFTVKGIRPDLSYDTLNYHLLNQLPGFKDNLHYHVLPGRFQMFGFRLGDRLFYPFRMLFGFRMGTLLNTAAILIIYRQVTVGLSLFLKMLKTQKPKKTRFRFSFFQAPSFLAFLIISRLELLQESGSYMVELLALPFFLEMLLLLLREAEKERCRIEAISFCLFGGIFFCMKMTNIVYLIPLILLYIWKIRKVITGTLFFRCLLVGLLPVCVYIVYNTVSMKNPIYPYYNSWFHSPYYPVMDFKDLRWGPETKKELIFWLYSMIRYPEYRLSEIPASSNWDLAVFYLVSVVFFLCFIWKRRHGQQDAWKKEDRIVGLLFSVYTFSFVLWAATTGHIRYFMGGLLVSGIVCACLLLRLQEVLLKGGWGRAAILCLFLPFLQRTVYGYDAVWNGYEWAFRDANREIRKEQLSLVFRDRELLLPEQKEKIDRFCLTQGDYGSLARIAVDQVPVWNVNSIVSELSVYQEDYKQEIEAAMDAGESVYDLFLQGMETLEAYLKWMNEVGWYVNDLFYPETILKGAQSVTLAGMELGMGRRNVCYQSQTIEVYEAGWEKKEEDNWIIKLQPDESSAWITALVGDLDYWMDPVSFEVEIFAFDGTNRKTAARFSVGETEYERKELFLDLSGLEGEIQLTLVCEAENRRVVLINPERMEADLVY